jgi:hypothetical protein
LLTAGKIAPMTDAAKLHLESLRRPEMAAWLEFGATIWHAEAS